MVPRLVPWLISMLVLSIWTHSKLILSQGFQLPISISLTLIKQLFLKAYFRPARTFISLQVFLPLFRHLGFYNLKCNRWQIFACWIHLRISWQNTIQHQSHHPQPRTWSHCNWIFSVKNELHHNWIRFPWTTFKCWKLLCLCQKQWPCSCRFIKASGHFQLCQRRNIPLWLFP